MPSLFHHQMHLSKHPAHCMDQTSSFSRSSLRFRDILSNLHHTPEYRIFRRISVYFIIGSFSNSLQVCAIIMIRIRRTCSSNPFIIYFSAKDEFYYIPFSDIINFWERSENGGRKSFTYSEINQDFRIYANHGIPVHYLEAIQKDIELR